MKYFVERSNETKHGYLIMLSQRSIRNEKKKQNLNKARTGWQKDGKSAKKQTGMSQDNRKFLDNLTEEKDTAASQHNKRNKKKLYDTTRNMSIRFKVTSYQFRDLNGCLISCRRDGRTHFPNGGLLLKTDRTLGQRQTG